MCEATYDQLQDPLFHHTVETMYNTKITVVINACGSEAYHAKYPGDPKVVAFSPYHEGTRDRKTEESVNATLDAWSRGEAVAFHCNWCFHRGVLDWVITMVEVFGCDPEDRMSIVSVVSRVGHDCSVFLPSIICICMDFIRLMHTTHRCDSSWNGHSLCN